ncbi:MAG: hypothetical protein FWG17_05055 [Desulfovibrionaceae bacterium]|nr:hypothetical protein [Desulfovibrionaceae bacterium]
MFCIYSSLEAQFFPAVGVFDGDVVPACPVDGKPRVLQGGKHIFSVMDKTLLQFGRNVGVNGVLGLSPLILSRRFAPADQSCPVQIGMFRGMQTGAGGIIRPCPTFPMIMEIAEYAKGFFPARWEGVEGFTARQLHSWNDKMKFMVPQQAGSRLKCRRGQFLQ